MRKLREFVLDHKRIVISAVIGMILLLSPAYYFYNKYHNLEMTLKNPGAVQRQSTEDIVKKVNAHIQLPKDEIPQLVTVSDKSKLIGLPFFKNAQNGDKVLLFKMSKMAYLYRPGTDQLINAAPIIDPESAAGGAAAGTATSAAAPAVSPSPVKVTIYNGTTTAGYAREIGRKVTQAYPAATIAGTANAKDQTHTKTLVIDITGKNKDAAAAIAKQIGGEMGQLPPGEDKPSSDILVIAGK